MEMDNRSVRLNKKSNLLKLDEYMYPLVDTEIGRASCRERV